ncbi:hypothetical protein [Neobacillus drentensis]|uniref:hypothetical protein n=1 Tax=Neobacillus drentensis TaxID=220684 RepID=UPI00300066EA
MQRLSALLELQSFYRVKDVFLQIETPQVSRKHLVSCMLDYSLYIAAKPKLQTLSISDNVGRTCEYVFSSTPHALPISSSIHISDRIHFSTSFSTIAELDSFTTSAV